MNRNATRTGPGTARSPFSHRRTVRMSDSNASASCHCVSPSAARACANCSGDIAAARCVGDLASGMESGFGLVERAAIGNLRNQRVVGQFERP